MCLIAIDYDGTITANFDAARVAIERLRALGHQVIIWSSRNNPRQHGEQQNIVFSQMLQELQHHNIPYDYIDYGDCGKYHAQVYIDDKAWRFENNWDDIINKIY